MAWTGRISLAKELKTINLQLHLVLAFKAQLVRRRVNVLEVRGSILVLGNIFFFFLVLLFFLFLFCIFRKTCFHFLTDLKYTGRLIADSFSHFISKVQ